MLRVELHNPSAFRILVAEADEFVCRGLDVLLSREGYQVCTTRSGVAAFDLAQKMKFDLAILDVDLPDLDGLALCYRLRDHPSTKALPVLISSSWLNMELMANGAGAAGYLEKPLGLRKLSERIRTMLHAVPSRSANAQDGRQVTPPMPASPQREAQLGH